MKTKGMLLKILISFSLAGLLLSSCGDVKKKFEEPVPETKAVPAGMVGFSGYLWRIISTDVQDSVYKKSNHVFTDEQGRLHLIIRQYENSCYGAELLSDSTFGSGTYTFYIESNIDSLNRYVNFSLMANNFKSENRNNFYEVGIRFCFWGIDYDYNPIEYYLFTQKNQVPIDYKSSKPTALASQVTTHKFSINSSEIKFESYRDYGYKTSDFIDSFTIEKKKIKTEAYPTIDNKMNVRILFDLVDYDIELGKEIEVIIKKFEYVPFL